MRARSRSLNEPISLLITAASILGPILAEMDWSNLGWDEEAATKKLSQSLIDNNSLHLFPAKKHGGPWRDNLGAGRLDIMTPEELRYFIEWRIPVWKRNMDGKDWGKTKDRVKKRYYRVADALQRTAIELYVRKYGGPYTHSGLYDAIVAAYPKGSQNLADSASWQILSFKNSNQAGEGTTASSGGSFTNNTAPSQGGGIKATASNVKGTLSNVRNIASGQNPSNTSQQAGFSISKSLPTILLVGAGLGLGYKLIKDSATSKPKTKKPFGLNQVQEVVL